MATDGHNLEIIEDPQLVWLLDYWRTLAGPTRLPPRRAVEPLDLPPRLWRAFFFYDVLSGPRDYRMRLAGSLLCATVGREMKGLTFDEIHPSDQAAAIRREFDLVVATARPHYAERTAGWLEDGSPLPYKRLLLPFAEDGETVDTLGGAAIFRLPVGAASAPYRGRGP
ncbi:MAG: PAS domain-containing protein [Inquilinaceae bacterium]